MTSAAELIASLGDDCSDCRFAQGRGYGMVHCPAHDDPKPSLSVRDNEDGKVLFHCFAGCSQQDLVATLRTRGLWKVLLRPPQEIVAEYDYVDRAGTLLYQVIRFEPKRFQVRRPGPSSSWIWNLEGTPRVLYRLPELLAAISRAEAVFVVEGEKDADMLHAVGLTATTCSGGAGRWNETYSQDMRGADVVVIPDNDDAGRRHAQDVAFGCSNTARRVRVLSLQLKDVSEWIAMGGTAPKLLELLEKSDWHPIWLS